MKSLEELREFFSHDRYATATTGIEILEAQDGYAKVGLAVREGHMNAGNRVMGAVYYTMADFAFAVASNPDAGDAPITFTLSSQINFLTPAKGSVDHDGNADKHISGVVILIGTCGESNDPVDRFGFVIRGEGGFALCKSQIAVKFFLIDKYRIDLSLSVSDVACQYIQSVDMIRCQVPHVLVLIIVILMDILMKRSKHGSVLHMMAIDDSVDIRQIGIVVAVHENAAGGIILSVDHSMNIGIIALAAQDRIIDLCAIAVDPADHIGVLGDEAVEIYGDRTGCHGVVVRDLRLDIIGNSLLILLLSFMIFVEDRIEAIAAESDDR